MGWRVNGTFRMPHFLANYQIMLFPIFMRLFMFHKPNASEKKINIWYGVMLVPGIFIFYLTYARGAWIGFAVAVALMLLFSISKSRYRPKVKWAFAVFLIFSTLFTARYLSSILGEFGSGRQHAVDHRWEQFRVAGRIIKGRPLFGSGLDNYELVSPDYLTPEERSRQNAWQYIFMVHNSYLYFAAEAGLVSAAIMFWGIFVLFRMGYGVIRSRSPYISNFAIGTFTGFVAIMISFLSGPDIHMEQFKVQFGLLVGLLVAFREIEAGHNRRKLQEKRKDRIS